MSRSSAGGDSNRVAMRGGRRWRARAIVSALLAVAVWTAAFRPPDARSFVLDEVLTNGTPQDASDDLSDAARWSFQPGSLVDEGTPSSTVWSPRPPAAQDE